MDQSFKVQVSTTMYACMVNSQVMSSAECFQNQLFKKKSLESTIGVSNILDSDQDRRFVGPDLHPNCLQRLLAAKLNT